MTEGSLQAPTRHPVEWKGPDFYDEPSLFKELERVFDICHGCRRCFNLCNSFPTLFAAVDASSTGEVDGVAKPVYWEVVDNCYLCDMCYMTKCPYVPPHPWNVDFPHLMLRAKAVKFERGDTSLRDRVLSATDLVGSIAGIPVIAEIVNAANRSGAGRALLEKTLGVHRDAPVPEYHSDTFRRRELRRDKPVLEAVPTNETRGKVAIFATCYCNRNEPDIDADLAAILEHNGISVTLTS
jgi:glycerol-3-phosphate dehydrogenase subunit C